MDNSLIPRPFSPTDAKRRAEENAREAERRSSARNMSSGSIGADGAMDVDGDLNVKPGANVNVSQGGAVKVAGTFKASAASTPVNGTATLGTDTDATGAKTPGMFYTDQAGAKYGMRFKAGALALDSTTSTPAPYPTGSQQGKFYADAVAEFTVYANQLQMLTAYGSNYGQVKVRPDLIQLETATQRLELGTAGVLVNGAPIGESALTKQRLDGITGNTTNTLPPLVLVTLTGANQPATANGDTAISWTARDGDTAMNPTANPTRLVAPLSGLYFLSGNATLLNVGGGMRGVWFRKNGVTRLRGQSNPPPSADQYAELDGHNYVRLNAGDYIEVMVVVAGAAGAVSIMANEGTAAAMEWKRP